MRKKQSNRKTSLNWLTVVSLLLISFALIVVSYGVTSAWLMDESITSNGEPNINVVGTVDLEIKTDFNFYNLALAPDTIYKIDQDKKDIGTYIKTSTKNDVREVYVRVKYTTNRDELTLYFEGNFSEASTYSTAVKNHWVYNERDGYYYFVGYIWTDFVQFNAGYRVDNTLNNDVATEDVYIRLDFEAIQRPYGAYKAVWNTAPDVFNQFAEQDDYKLPYVNPNS